MSKYPTASEFDMLQSFWRRGTATIRDVKDDFDRAGIRLAYTSIATIVRIMLGKKYVELVDARRPQKFRALVDEASAKQRELLAAVQRIHGGSIDRTISELQALKRTRKSA